MRRARKLLAATACSATALLAPAGDDAFAQRPPAFLPIHHTTLALPPSIQPYGPSWMPDGRHILFQNQVDGRTWTIGADGRDLHCVTCGFGDDPAFAGGLNYAFPDQKRLFLSKMLDVTYGSGGRAAAYGVEWLSALAGINNAPLLPGGGAAYVVECQPSILDCRTHQLLPIDMSADANPLEPVGMRRTWHLAPDGVHLMWMDVRPDGTVMIIARLVRAADRYIATDQRVISPPAPTGLADTDSGRWATVGQTFEGKSFARGGSEVEYLGGPGAGNFDVMTVNLTTGVRRRLTSSPEWDEDGAVSPDGRLLVTASWRTMHRLDVLGGMMPELHAFIDLPFMSGVVGYYVSTHEGFQCDLTPWLLGSSGDHDGQLLGQPLAPYSGGPSYVANNLVGAPIWSPDGTKVLLQERIYGPPHGGAQESSMGSVPNRLLIANIDRAPSKPLPTVSSAVGPWAAKPSTYGTAFDHPSVVTVAGKATGTAVITYVGNILSSHNTVTYRHYSDDGQTFADGTESITNPQTLAAPPTLRAAITITGKHHGYWRAQLTVGASQDPLGTVESELDGKHLSGLPRRGACPASLPRATPLVVHQGLRVRRGQPSVAVHVTATIFGAGLTETSADSRPVQDATVDVAGREVHTDANGFASLLLPTSPTPRRYTMLVTAGDTFLPARTTVEVRGDTRTARRAR
jgi:hypothetical protein